MESQYEKIKQSRLMDLQSTRPPVRLAPVVRAKTLGDQAYESLREALASGALPPGHRLTVRGLVEMLDIGFTPAREALNRLAAEGCLEVGERRALVVPALTLARYEESVAIRMALEPMAAIAALPHLSDTDIEALDKVQEGLLEAKERADYASVLAHNRAFHFSIYRHCGMPTLLSILESLWLQTGPTLRLLYPRSLRQWRGGVNHASVMKALRKRDAAALGEAIRKDLRDGRRHLLEQLRTAP
ncbi:MAG: GntR family transcriptional regulator [Variovorax sp.]